MTRRFLAFVVAITFIASTPFVDAGTYNLVLDIGDDAPHWNDLPGTDGAKHSFADLEDAKAVVVVFTCNSCPYAVDIEDRLLEFDKEFSKRGVALVAINVNKVEDDLMPAMKEKAEEKKFTFTYLFDETQKIAKDYGAKYTPEFFVLDGDRKVAYMGSMDDSPDGTKVSQKYVQLAVESVLKGEDLEKAETVPIGCRVRYDRKRRTRRSRPAE